MPTINLSPFLRGSEIPQTIEWERCDTLPYVAQAIRSRVDNGLSSTAIGLAIHLSKDASVDVIALCAGDKAFVFSCQEPRTKAKAKVSDRLALANALAMIFGGETLQLAGFNAHRLASYICQRFDCRVVATNLSHRDYTPGNAAKDFLSPSSNSFSIDELWDIDHDVLDSGEETNLLVIRAWISAR